MSLQSPQNHQGGPTALKGHTLNLLNSEQVRLKKTKNLTLPFGGRCFRSTNDDSFRYFCLRPFHFK